MASPCGSNALSTGRLRLWTNLVGGRPPLSEYVGGWDVSGGGAASNSVGTFADTQTHRLVAELATINLWPHELAVYAAAMGRFFCDRDGNDALMVYEKNGPGGTFGHTLLTTCGYLRVWMDRNEDDLAPKISTKPAWQAGRQSKENLHGAYRSDLATGRFINPCEESIDELKNFVYLPGGGVGFAGVDDIEDPTGAKDNHGDRGTSAALCAMLIEGSAPEEAAAWEPEVPPNSIQGRMEARQARAERQSPGTELVTNKEFAVNYTLDKLLGSPLQMRLRALVDGKEMVPRAPFDRAAVVGAKSQMADLLGFSRRDLLWRLLDTLTPATKIRDPLLGRELRRAGRRADARTGQHPQSHRGDRS